MILSHLLQMTSSAVSQASCVHMHVVLCLPLYTSFLYGYVTADHSVNGDSGSDGENEEFAMVEDQTGRLTYVGIEIRMSVWAHNSMFLNIMTQMWLLHQVWT